MMRFMAMLLATCLAWPLAASAQGTAHWVTAWTGSAQGPYPVGNASAQPNLSFAFPTPAAALAIRHSG